MITFYYLSVLIFLTISTSSNGDICFEMKEAEKMSINSISFNSINSKNKKEKPVSLKSPLKTSCK